MILFIVWFSREWKVTGSGAGCYYQNSHQIPVYSLSRPSTITISIRHYQDSLIAADEFTYGCSYSSPDSSSCFGSFRQEEYIIGVVIIGAGVVLFIIYIIVVLYMHYCSEEGAKILAAKRPRRRTMPPPKRRGRSIPTAQPVYSQQKQQQKQKQKQQKQKQKQKQPSSIPQQQKQPSSIPQQQQQQPSYIPQQQPSYIPQQTGYIPQYGYVSRQ